MTVADRERIDAYLAELKAECRSSPEGIYWHRLWELLKNYMRTADDEPPKPFILAASASSNASKLARLGEQLTWAAEHACLDKAFLYLSGVDRSFWSSCLPERWDKHSYY